MSFPSTQEKTGSKRKQLRIKAKGKQRQQIEESRQGWLFPEIILDLSLNPIHSDLGEGMKEMQRAVKLLVDKTRVQKKGQTDHVGWAFAVRGGRWWGDDMPWRPLMDHCQSQQVHSGGVDISKVLRRERVEGVSGKETSVKERRGDELVSRYPLEI